MRSDSLVSVGLPTFNRRDALTRATRSVLGQTYRPIQVVISDNASDDGTPEDLNVLEATHSEVRVLTNRSNIGPAANFERVRDATEGDFFMWLGDDDWLDANYIDECLRVLSSDPSTVLVAGACRYHADDRDWVESPRVDLTHEDAEQRVLDYFRQVTSNAVFYGVARRSALAELPAVPNLMGGDWLHLASLAFLGKVRTTGDTEIHRSVGGATRSLAQVAQHQGLGWLSRNAPQIALAWVTLADIGWRSSIYHRLGRQRRFLLGVRAAGIITTRFLPGAVAKFFRLQIGRMRTLPAVDRDRSGVAR